MTAAIGYCRVSTDQQGESGLGLSAQKSAIHAEVQRRGWDFQTMYADVGSGKSTKGRTDLANALSVLTDGEADVLVVAKLDRLSRSLHDFAGLMTRAEAEGWAIVALDIGVDTSTINGELVANIIMALAQWERRIIGQRTKDALGAVRERGTRLGRPPTIPDETLTLIRLLHRNGRSLNRIARMLNEEDVPTGQGGRRWYPSTVRAALARAAVPPG